MISENEISKLIGTINPSDYDTDEGFLIAIEEKIGKKIDANDVLKVKAVLKWILSCKMKSQNEVVKEVYKISDEEKDEKKIHNMTRNIFLRVRTKYPEIFRPLLDKKVVNMDGILKRLNDIALNSDDLNVAIKAGGKIIDTTIQLEKMSKENSNESIDDIAFEGKTFRAVIEEMKKKSASYTKVIDAEYKEVEGGDGNQEGREQV